MIYYLLRKELQSSITTPMILYQFPALTSFSVVLQEWPRSCSIFWRVQ